MVGRRRARADPERPANPVDHYSLVLQLIQVFPIISGVVLALVTVTWLARVLAAGGLVVGTLWVVWQERSRGTARQRRADVPVVVARPGEVRADTRAAAAVVDALLNSPAAVGEYGGDYREVRISIRVSGPAPSTFRHRYRRRRLRERRSRPALARGEPPGDRRPAARPGSSYRALRTGYRTTKSDVSPK